MSKCLVFFSSSELYYAFLGASPSKTTESSLLTRTQLARRMTAYVEAIL